MARCTTLICSLLLVTSCVADGRGDSTDTAFPEGAKVRLAGGPNDDGTGTLEIRNDSERKKKPVDRVAGENGIDTRIDLTPVTDGSLDWKYRAVVRNETLVKASISTLLQVPDWVPKDKRAAPNANYYLYHSKHGRGSISMLWAETMEDVLAGRLTPYNHEVDAVTAEFEALLQRLPADGVAVRPSLLLEATEGGEPHFRV